MEITKEAVKNRHDVLAPDPKPTVYLIKMEKLSLTFMVNVYATGFMYNSIIQDYMNTKIVDRFRQEGIVIS